MVSTSKTAQPSKGNIIMAAGTLRRLIIGERLATKRAKHQRLPNYLALPVFASDALSSNAYATEEILLMLMLAGSAGFHYTLPIGIVIATVLVIVVMSYRQTIFAYPQGGGAYIVTRDNLGLVPGLIAAASLLIDYVLTVAVSVSAGVLAITSAAHGTQFEYLGNPYPRIGLCLACIGFITVANLRGAKESGALFAGPTYLFIGSMFILIIVGLIKYFTGSATPMQVIQQVPSSELQALTPFLILRAFASGCAALTGIEAVSDGIPAFRPPEAQNAAKTLVAMAAILTTVFLGLTFLASAFHAQPLIEGVSHGHVTGVRESLISNLARHIFGKNPFYYVIQAGTALILILAANTAYQDFPRLSSFLARDRLAPRALGSLGDRLVFQNGILLLGFFAALITFVFKGEVNKLIPLYALGVFLSFTLSQASMVKRWWTRREPGWQKGALCNALGAMATCTVLVVIILVKFTQGAWMVVGAIAFLLFAFLKIHRHYEDVKRQLTLDGYKPPRTLNHSVIVLVPGLHRGIIPALLYAKSIAHNVRAVFVEMEPGSSERLREQWAVWGQGIPLFVLKSYYRELREPLLNYIDTLIREENLDLVTVVLPEFETTKWWHKFLHNQTGLYLKFALLFKPKVAVTNIRYHLEE
jgi:amino acid transporter